MNAGKSRVMVFERREEEVARVLERERERVEEVWNALRESA